MSPLPNLAVVLTHYTRMDWPTSPAAVTFEFFIRYIIPLCRSGGMVDAQVLGTCVPLDVWVRVPPPARIILVPDPELR